MEFTFVEALDDKIVASYTDLVNRVMQDEHSLGFLQELDGESAKRFLSGQISQPNSALLLAYENEELIGAGYVGPSHYTTSSHYGELSKVMVNPEKQRKGIGKEIVRSLEQKAMELGYTDLIGDTWDIPHIVEFYEKCGYQTVGRIPHFVKDREGNKHDSVIFVKQLVESQ